MNYCYFPPLPPGGGVLLVVIYNRIFLEEPPVEFLLFYVFVVLYRVRGGFTLKHLILCNT